MGFGKYHYAKTVHFIAINELPVARSMPSLTDHPISFSVINECLDMGIAIP
jgi:hypothetical protein